MSDQLHVKAKLHPHDSLPGEEDWMKSNENGCVSVEQTSRSKLEEISPVHSFFARRQPANFIPSSSSSSRIDNRMPTRAMPNPHAR